MYLMLLAADSWPGSRLPESKGNPFVHDVLDRLGLLDAENDRDIETEISTDGDISDEQPTTTDDAKTIGVPESLHPNHEMVSQLNPGQSSTLPDFTTFEPQQLADACDTRKTSRPWQHQLQSQPHSFSSFPQPLSTDFVLRPPPRMTASLPTTLPSAQNLEVQDWDAANLLEPWWQQGPQTLLPSANIEPPSEMPNVNTTADTNALGISVNCGLNSYLVDPGVYACDFDVD
ncbi:hypothetical protein QM012_008162 [Aureobasidium pullulans]|uniref:Uncharacterized protein n=1 Tax=Aureobasidium pullulans TaxID=5580 RepID=A0ABR0TLR2_AURPU